VTTNNVVDRLLEALRTTPLRIARFYRDAATVAEESRAGTEHAALAHDSLKQEMLAYLRQRGLESLKFSAETVDAASRLLRLPSLMFTPGTVVRSGLESAGLICWLTQRNLSSNQRVQRAIAIGKEDWNQEVGLAQSALQTGDNEEFHKGVLEWALAERSKFFECVGAIQLKAVKVPTDWDLVALCDAGYEYRLNTALAHGNPTVHKAIEAMFRGPGATHDSMGVALLNYLTTSADSYCRASWSYGCYVLAPNQIQELRALLEEVYESMHISETVHTYLYDDALG
jgi:hypothetical protein